MSWRDKLANTVLFLIEVVLVMAAIYCFGLSAYQPAAFFSAMALLLGGWLFLELNQPKPYNRQAAQKKMAAIDRKKGRSH